MSNSNAARSFENFKNEVNRFGNYLGDMHVQAKGYEISVLLLASQCQDFSIGLLSLKDSLVLSSRLTLLRGLFEASMRLNYLAIEGEAGALNLECTDLCARVSKFELAKKNCPELQCSQIEAEKKKLDKLRCEKRINVSFADVLSKTVDKKNSSDYWLYRHWSGIAHSELFELSCLAVKPSSEVDSVTSLTCSSDQLAEIYQHATLMLKRAENCLVDIFKIGSDSYASE